MDNPVHSLPKDKIAGFALSSPLTRRETHSSTGWVDLPVRCHAGITQLHPVFSYPIRKDQGSSLHRDRVMKPSRYSRLHGEFDFHTITGEGVGCLRPLTLMLLPAAHSGIRRRSGKA